MKEKKYQFKRAVHIQKRLLICPQCYEYLSQLDIEHFQVCPYCEYRFENNDDIEDFILQPFIENWMSQFENLSQDGPQAQRPGGKISS